MYKPSYPVYITPVSRSDPRILHSRLMAPPARYPDAQKEANKTPAYKGGTITALEGNLVDKLEDECLDGCLLTHEGEVKHDRAKALFETEGAQS